MEMSTRDPYPFPRLQNDDDFMTGENFTMVHGDVYKEPTHLAQRKDPWNRLYGTRTLASARREIHHFDPQAPRDSLDFILKADYDHHKQLLEPASITLIQPETIGDDHGRILKNRKPKEVEKKEDEAPEPSLKKVVVQKPKKESIHSVKGAIESHHSAATNGGYSRKHDGGFYTT